MEYWNEQLLNKIYEKLIWILKVHTSEFQFP